MWNSNINNSSNVKNNQKKHIRKIMKKAIKWKLKKNMAKIMKYGWNERNQMKAKAMTKQSKKWKIWRKAKKYENM